MPKEHNWSAKEDPEWKNRDVKAMSGFFTNESEYKELKEKERKAKYMKYTCTLHRKYNTYIEYSINLETESNQSHSTTIARDAQAVSGRYAGDLGPGKDLHSRLALQDSWTSTSPLVLRRLPASL